MGVGWGGSRGQGLDGWETKDLVSSTLYFWTSQVLLVVKNLPANAGDERDVHSITGSEDPLEKGLATHSSILAWRSPWTEEPGRLQ